jgi:hypothetical protein
MTRHITLGTNGVCCPRCGRATEIREHKGITPKQLRKVFYYRRWYFCVNPPCRTSTIVLPVDRVFNVEPETERRVTAITEQLGLALEHSSEAPPW